MLLVQAVFAELNMIFRNNSDLKLTLCTNLKNILLIDYMVIQILILVCI